MYRPPCVRNFKLFMGELTAEASAVHISLLESEKNERGEEKYWNRIATEAGMKLDGITSSRILKSQIRLSIVSIYSGFSLFLEEIESECKSFGFEWIKPEKVSPLEVLEKNFTRAPDSKTHLRHTFDTIDYFRVLRNSIAHPSEENKTKAVGFYKSRKESIDYIRTTYNMVSAPNQPDKLSFHDIKFWCQLLLDCTETIVRLLEPDESMIYSMIPFDRWRKYGKDHNKIKKVAKNYIHSKYSYSLDIASQIVEKVYDPLA